MQLERLRVLLSPHPVKSVEEKIDETYLVTLENGQIFHIKHYMIKTIGQRINCSPETPWMVLRSGCTMRMEPVTKVLYIPKGKSIGEVVTLSDGSEIGCAAVQWESGTLEKIFVKDGKSIRRSGIKSWDSISNEYDLYRNPLNKKYWDSMPYLTCGNEYEGEDIFLLPAHQVAFMKANGAWMPTSPAWLDRIKHEEYQMWKGILQYA